MTPLCVPPRITVQPAQEARRSEVPRWGTEAAACRDAAEPLISMTWLTSPIPRTAVPLRHRLPRQEHRPVHPPGPSSPASSPPTFLRVWLSLHPPFPSLTDNLEVNQRTFAKDRLVLTPSCEDGWWEAGRHLDSSLRGQCTRCPRNAHRMQRQDFAEGGFLFLFPWKNETTTTTTKKPTKPSETTKKTLKKTHLPLLSSLEILLKKKKTNKK